MAKLRFDVGIERYTTETNRNETYRKLRFDVGIERYTTLEFFKLLRNELRFDVGIERYTTHCTKTIAQKGCGLM